MVIQNAIAMARNFFFPFPASPISTCSRNVKNHIIKSNMTLLKNKKPGGKVPLFSVTTSQIASTI